MTLIVLVAVCLTLLAAAGFAILNDLSPGELLSEVARFVRGFR